MLLWGVSRPFLSPLAQNNPKGTGSVPDQDDHLHPGRDRAGMTLKPAGTGTGMISKPGRVRDQGHSDRDCNRDLTHFLMLYVPLDVHIN